MRDIRHVIFHSPGPRWEPGKAMFEHYRQLLHEGKLLLGGPFLDGAGGGMMVPAAGLDEQELRAFANADPAVLNGLLKAEVRPWLIGMHGHDINKQG